MHEFYPEFDNIMDIAQKLGLNIDKSDLNESLLNAIYNVNTKSSKNKVKTSPNPYNIEQAKELLKLYYELSKNISANNLPEYKFEQILELLTIYASKIKDSNINLENALKTTIISKMFYSNDFLNLEDHLEVIVGQLYYYVGKEGRLSMIYSSSVINEFKLFADAYAVI